jgi:hypothetical protein
VDVQEASRLEELVSGERQTVSHAHNGTSGVGSVSEVGLLSQKLHTRRQPKTKIFDLPRVWVCPGWDTCHRCVRILWPSGLEHRALQARSLGPWLATG